jgi:hypothetical protein
MNTPLLDERWFESSSEENEHRHPGTRNIQGLIFDDQALILNDITKYCTIAYPSKHEYKGDSQLCWSRLEESVRASHLFLDVTASRQFSEAKNIWIATSLAIDALTRMSFWMEMYFAPTGIHDLGRDLGYGTRHRHGIRAYLEPFVEFWRAFELRLRATNAERHEDATTFDDETSVAQRSWETASALAHHEGTVAALLFLRERGHASVGDIGEAMELSSEDLIRVLSHLHSLRLVDLDDRTLTLTQDGRAIGDRIDNALSASL